MSFREYAASKIVSLCLATMAGVYLAFVIYFCSLPMSLLFGLLLSEGAAVLLCLFFGWRRADRHLRTLKERLNALPKKYLIGETIECPRDAMEQKYYMLMKEISRSAIGAVEQARADKQDYCTYVESWVHEIKTPLTACSLILSNGADPAKLRRELLRADNLTESILTYAKLPGLEQDTQITKARLRTICDRAVRQEMELLIGAGISVTIDGDCEVFTDTKSVLFILKQLLINCAKYCPNCQIRMELSEGKLVFEDNGPGIPTHELNRVTQRGFTGTAGRKFGQSTGMGLYIVNQLCEKLNIRMEITSEEGAFTRFIFSFPATSLRNR